MNNNAMIAKTKALYGKRLTEDDYLKLVNMNTIPEVVNYLKTETDYKTVLANVNENTIHRRELEEVIKTDVFNRFVKLIRYDNSAQNFFRYIVVREEISQILAISRSIELQDNKELIAGLPVYIIDHMSFDIRKLVNAHDYDTFLSLIKGSEYEQILKRNLRDNGINYTNLEIDLEVYYHKVVDKLIGNFSSASSRKALSDIFNYQAELQNIARIYRMKKYFKADANEIKQVLIDKYRKIHKKDLYMMIENYSASEFIEELGKGPYADYFSKDRFTYVEHSIDEVTYSFNRHNLYFGTDSEVVVMAYIELCKIELQNIIDIIEGIKYKLNKSKINDMLIK